MSDHPTNQTTGSWPEPPWDRECVLCACKWLEAEEGPKCPKCERKQMDHEQYAYTVST